MEKSRINLTTAEWRVMECLWETLTVAKVSTSYFRSDAFAGEGLFVSR